MNKIIRISRVSSLKVLRTGCIRFLCTAKSKKTGNEVGDFIISMIKAIHNVILICVQAYGLYLTMAGLAYGFWEFLLEWPEGCNVCSIRQVFVQF